VARTTLKAYALEYPSPGQVLTRTNRALFRESESNEFVTAFVAVLEPDLGRVRYANAGHPSPFACDVTGCRLGFAEPQTLLGALAETGYVDSEARLASGETMLLYTDGVLEARNEAGAFYGPDRLHDVLSHAAFTPVDSIPAEVYRDLAEFTGGRLADDLALFAVRPTGQTT
jgi:sigma-B regulation protein RsbU (phosphoserine phosphatase)